MLQGHRDAASVAASDFDPGNPSTRFDSLPQIRLNIVADSVSDRILSGVQEIIRHHIRPQTMVLTEGQPVAAGGLADPSGNDVPIWYWNVIFVQDDLLDLNTWACSTSSSQFAGGLSTLNGTSRPDESVQQPFTINIRYHKLKPSSAFRGLGHVLAVSRSLVTLASPQDDLETIHPNLLARSNPSSDLNNRWFLSQSVANSRLNMTETCQFDTVGTMVDCSRNGVLKLDSIKYLCRTLALMGYNMLQLYTEDTFQIPDEPFFGYMRGGYCQQELKQIDDYAYDLGIEVIPCIQTLGHLGQMLQWPCYLALRDTAEVLLAEWPQTYVMVEKMIRAASAPFRSNRIHLGMDETHGLGHGRYYSVFGHRNQKETCHIFVQHLQHVELVCKSLGLKPMIWSDMLFCLPSKNNYLVGYYDTSKPQNLEAEGIPDDVDLVYWDYYHTSDHSYSSRIESHRQLRGTSPWMAAGSWTWSRFWTALPFTFQTCQANLNTSKHSESGVRHVFLTIWGDEGNEIDLWSSLPAWTYYADHTYTMSDQVDTRLVKAKFDAIVGGHFDDFVLASKVDETSLDRDPIDADDKIHFAPNTSKWMLWSDPLHSFVEPSVASVGFDLERHYQTIQQLLTARIQGTVFEKAGTLALVEPITADTNDPSSSKDLLIRTIRDHPFNARLEMARLVSKTLALKAGLRCRLHKAYVSGDWETLSQLSKRIHACRQAAQQLWNYHRHLWMSMYKPAGWETLELRYGGLISRLDTLYWRVSSFLSHLYAGGQPGIPLQPDTSLMMDQASERTGVFLSFSTNLSDSTVPSSQPYPLSENPSESERNSDQNPSCTSVYHLPELADDLEVVYPSPDQFLDYHRVSRPTYC